ncbi:hypothetical protein DFP73DRAFT_534741 [Morchella snyderi]|nr:hypothetical protein DFP73DRAFT_534741 [Morchella snyderi]
MERSRRIGTKRAPHEKFAELRELKKSGKTRLSTYEVEEEEDLYVEVDEDEYKKVVRDRLEQDDFVVDDNGEGYIDNGMDDWGDEGRREGSYDEESDEGATKKGKGKSAKKRGDEAKRKMERDKDITKYFSSASIMPSVRPKKPIATEEDTDFMNSLLEEFNSELPNDILSSKRTREEPSTRKTRRLSPALGDKKKLSGLNKSANNDTRPPIPSSPPAVRVFDDEDDEYGAPIVDDDIPMSDAQIPPPPLAGTKQQKKVTFKQEEEDSDDDDLAIAEIKGNKGAKSEAINISASRPSLMRVPEPQHAASTPRKPIAIDSSAWKNLAGSLNVMSSPQVENTKYGKPATEDVLEEDGGLKIFWLDYTEVSGSLCLFGKVMDKGTNKYISAFLKIDGIQRSLFFLPKDNEEIEMTHVYDEVTSILDKSRITEYRSKSTSRKYAFELAGIPREGDYLKVQYSYNQPALPQKLRGNTFSHVFGTNTSLFEQFVLCRDVMGPCWLKIEGGDFSAVQNASWCKLEVQVMKPTQITVLGDDSSEPPPLTLMSIALRTHMNVKENKQEIIAISCRTYENVSLTDAASPETLPCQTFSIVRPINEVFPHGFEKAAERHRGTIRQEKTENVLLSSFLAKLQQADPDVLMGHQLESVDYSILLHRMKERKTPGWHRIGRMKRMSWPQYGGKMAGSFFAERQLVSGRLMCDLANDLGKSLLIKCQSWSLTEICELVLSEKRQELDNEEALRTWASNGEGLLDYVLHCEADTYFIAAVALKIQMLPLTKQLTNLAGNSWARTLSGTRAERNEYILLHEFYRNKFVCPDKDSSKGNKAIKADEEGGADGEAALEKKKDKYKGGLVFEPEKGLYDKFILVMDFNSLYPSIIQEYNICFTTVERNDDDEDKVPEVPEEQALGILPKLISALVQRRRQVKSLMKDKGATAVQKSQWDIKQQALKLTANSMYGCLGYTRSRFYARPLAMLTTFKGREILRATKELAESMSLRVIYGDTDSVMINTNVDNYSDAIKIGNEFKKKVNERYRLLEIDIDNIFQRLLLHAKKKYAAINYVEINGKLDTKLEVKGLDMRRREFCQLSKEVSSHILNEIFSGDETEIVVEKIHDYLRDLAAKIRGAKFPIMKYIIYTKLGKNPEDYPYGKTMPQVQVALRKKARGEPVKSGDVISYVITGDGEGHDKNPAERAYSIQDVQKPDSGLKPDPEWYLLKQIFPPIERLCGPIDGTDAMRLAECLGLDTKKYQIVNSARQEEREIHPLESTIPDDERFKNTAKLSLRCRSCKVSFEFEGLFSSQNLVSTDGIKCSNTSCGKLVTVTSVVAQLEYQIRSLTTKYYDAWLVCGDTQCGNRTRQMSVYGKMCLGPKGHASGCSGLMSYEYTDKMLYNQLLYFSSVFDVDKAKKRVEVDKNETLHILAENNRMRFKIISDAVQKYLEKCGRQWVSMESIFSFAA